jgi:hypothetical protein
MNPIEILDLKPMGHYADSSPIYRFHTAFPSKGVRECGEYCETPEEAYEQGRKTVALYLRTNWPGGMGEVLGVVRYTVSGLPRYRAVINTYYSNS